MAESLQTKNFNSQLSLSQSDRSPQSRSQSRSQSSSIPPPPPRSQSRSLSNISSLSPQSTSQSSSIPPPPSRPQSISQSNILSLSPQPISQSRPESSPIPQPLPRQESSLIQPIPQQPLIFGEIKNHHDTNIFVLLCLFNFVNNYKLFANIKYFHEIEKYKNFYFKGTDLNAKQKKYNKKFYNTIKYFYYDNFIIIKIIDDIFEKNIKINPDSTNNHSLVLTKIFDYNEFINGIIDTINHFFRNLKNIINNNNIHEFNDNISVIEEYINSIKIINDFDVKQLFNIRKLINIIFKNNISLLLKTDLKNSYENNTLQLICVQQENSSIFYYYYKNINDNEWFFSNNFYDNNSKINIGTFQDVIKHDERINNNKKNYSLFYLNLQ